MTESENIIYQCASGNRLNGTVRVPGDKSISHRSIMLGSLAQGTTEVTGFLQGDDAIATLNAFRAMGVKIEGPDNVEGEGNGRVTIHGVGLHGLTEPKDKLDLGNSGTSMRLISGLLVGQDFKAQLTGDSSLSIRPMKRITLPLSQMGANIETNAEGTPPLLISGNNKLNAIQYDMPMASAQVKSAILLAGMYAQGKTCVTEPAITRDHTERMLNGFGYPVKTDGNSMCIEGGGSLTATNIDIPADISSATFFIIGATIANGSDVTLQHVGINPTRIGVINIMRLMGADISVTNECEIGGEPVADIRVRSAKLTGIIIPEDQVPLAIDEFPAIFVAAACAQGRTTLTGAAELRVKESDRIQVMADALVNVGVQATPTDDGMVIEGGSIQGGTADSHGDHRIAMAMSVAALVSQEKIIINDCANVNTSFPGFVEMMNKLGHQISVSIVDN